MNWGSAKTRGHYAYIVYARTMDESLKHDEIPMRRWDQLEPKIRAAFDTMANAVVDRYAPKPKRKKRRR